MSDYFLEIAGERIGVSSPMPELGRSGRDVRWLGLSARDVARISAFTGQTARLVTAAGAPVARLRLLRIDTSLNLVAGELEAVAAEPSVRAPAERAGRPIAHAQIAAA